MGWRSQCYAATVRIAFRGRTIPQQRQRMSFAQLLRKQSETFNTKLNNATDYSAQELDDLLLQASMVCESAAARGSYRCRYIPYLPNRILHPESREFVERLRADGINATPDSNGYLLDWSTTEPEPDYSHVPHVVPRIAPVVAAPAVAGTNSDDDVDDKTPPNKE